MKRRGRVVEKRGEGVGKGVKEWRRGYGREKGGRRGRVVGKGGKGKQREKEGEGDDRGKRRRWGRLGGKVGIG